MNSKNKGRGVITFGQGTLCKEALLVRNKVPPPRRGWCSVRECLPLQVLEKLGWLPDFKNQQKEATPA